jgi:hypothetical protein
MGEDHPENGVTEEFKALVMRGMAWAFVGNGRVSQSQAEQSLVLKGVPQPFLQLAQVCHRSTHDRFDWRAV